MDTIAISAQARTAGGKKGAKAVRNAGQVPCVIYGGEENVHFSAATNSFKKLIYTADFKLAEITIDDKAYKCIIKDAQFHPVSDDLLHVDFLQLVDKQQVKVNLPVRFIGTAPGTKEGGKLSQQLRRVKVKTTPEYLVDELQLDISNLNLGHSVRVRDITPVEGVEIMSAGATPVASVVVPRALRSATSAAGEEGEEGGEEAASEG